MKTYQRSLDYVDFCKGFAVLKHLEGYSQEIAQTLLKSQRKKMLNLGQVIDQIFDCLVELIQRCSRLKFGRLEVLEVETEQIFEFFDKFLDYLQNSKS